jgi:hypothetical protein
MEDARPCRDIPSSTSREAAGVGPFGFCAGNSADLARFVACLAPEPVCDLCIAQKRSLDDVALASHASHELAGSHGFEPFEGVCSLCDQGDMVIRRR